MFLPFWPTGARSVGIRPLLRSMHLVVEDGVGRFSVGIRPSLRSMQLVVEAGGEFLDSPCAPADSEPEADVVDRHAKSGL